MTQKERIIEVSLQQFLEHGIRQMTIQKLIEPLGLSTKTVYKYFADKEDLLKQCLFFHYFELSERFTLYEKAFSNPVENILTFYNEVFKLDFGKSQAFYHDLNYYYPQLQDLLIEKFFSRGAIIIKNLIAEGIEGGYYLSGLKADVIFETFTLLYTNITRSSKLKELNYSPNVLMQNTLVAYIRGICTEKGLISFEDFQKSKNRKVNYEKQETKYEFRDGSLQQ
jgi:AcrR family transcriptional regulator